MSKRPIHVIAEDRELMAEWNYEKNSELGLNPETIGMASHTKVWWKCSAGHSWFAMVSNRSRHNRACPYCAHQLPIPGETDLATLFPDLAKEWDSKKNNSKPSEVMPGAHKKAWWICSEGHEWEAEIKSRTTGVGCPYCCGKRVLKGFNDLATVNPFLAAEWHPTKNGDLTPEDVTDASGKKVWWLCKNGHDYEMAIYNRKRGSGCPKCSDVLRTSFPEQAIFYYIKQEFPDAVNGYKDIFESSMELDIYIPSLKVGIEYDGKVYHAAIGDRTRQDSTGCPVCKRKRMSQKNTATRIRKKGSFAGGYPELLTEWDYEKNADLSPYEVTPGTGKKAWWKCKTCGFEWYSSISHRVQGRGCPCCNHRIIVPGINDLATLRPELLREWDYVKNTLNPNEVSIGSGKKASWKCCVCGHEWAASIASRAAGHGCPNWREHKE